MGEQKTMKTEIITDVGSAKFTSNGKVFLDFSVGDFKRSLRIESDGRVFDETETYDEIEI